ncbi:MAG: hypothetical protein JSW58_10310 [Candidatus Latescibacterota bacterium]|nr:MAG: hypothetical protein JSW58_10310 [Candidatus Latescibacterota bacterium]
MFFGFWNTARNNKENILYTFVTIFLLERVRTGWNRIHSRGQKEGTEPARIQQRQHALVVKAAFLYALPFLLPLVKYIYRSIDELSWSVQGLVILKTTPAFFIVLVLTECFLAVVIYNLLRIYIEKMNAAVGFFTKIGRNIWDGSKAAVQVGGSVSQTLAGGLRSLSSGAWNTASGAWSKTTSRSRRSVRRLLAVPKSVRKIRPRLPLRFARRAQTVETGGS